MNTISVSKDEKGITWMSITTHPWKWLTLFGVKPRTETFFCTMHPDYSIHWHESGGKEVAVTTGLHLARFYRENRTKAKVFGESLA